MSLQLLLSEAAKRAQSQQWRKVVDLDHAKQAAFVTDPSRFIGAECTRRAGKSNGLAYRFFRAAMKYPGSLSPYVALTRRSAYNIMWPIFRQVAHENQIEAQFTKSDLTITLANDSQIQLFGADTDNLIDRLRGPKYPFAAIDEAQSFKEHISELLDDVLTPAIGDYDDGAIAVTGTPGPVASGLFYEICMGKLGFSMHRWSWADNPYLKNYAAFVADIKARRGWTDDHPTFLREWLGKWVQDLDALVYKFKWDRNVTAALPMSDHWRYVLGVDLGYDPDPSAFVLCAYNPFNPKLYIIETFKKTKMDVSDVANMMKDYMRRFPNLKIIVDAGGQGKQITAEISKRHAVPLQAAEKTGKAGFIEIMNADFIKGHIQILESCAKGIGDEYVSLIWDSASRDRKEDGRFPNHYADAALYAWRYCYNYVWQTKPKIISPHSEEAIDLFFEKEAQRLHTEKQQQQDDLMAEMGF